MKIIFGLTMIFMLMFASTAFAEERIPTISVSGEGRVETAPDTATISVGVVTRGKDAEKIQAENARTAAEIINSIAALGVERKNIRTGNYSFRQIYRQDSNNRRIFDGYEVNNTVTITLSNLNLVGKVVDTSLSHGANSIDSLEFGLRDKDSFQNEAIRLAVRNARTKAEIVAAELGKNILSVLNVSVNSGSVSVPRYRKLANLAVAEDASFETPIESGTLSCSASVHIEFEISR